VNTVSILGRKLTLRHFRDGKELPWLSSDHQYNFNYQQNRPLREMAKVLPGDHLTYECQTETSDRNFTTLAGLSTRHEMCETFVWYYPKQDLISCGSYYDRINKFFNEFGIEEVDW